MLTKLKAAKKTVAAVTTAVIGWGAAVVVSTPTGITASEWIVLATAVATGLGVYSATNLKAG